MDPKDWNLVVAFLAPRGMCAAGRPPGLYAACWSAADGFGRGHPFEYHDWSHFRDSTDEGVKRVASVIREQFPCSTGKNMIAAIERLAPGQLLVEV